VTTEHDASEFVISSREQRKILHLLTSATSKKQSGFIAAASYSKIINDIGGIARDIDNWSFLLNGKEYDSINPSLHLCNAKQR
jgi:alkyl sulfatase BDS1-like metallo-beta-lactamase superfamily hydrolase